MGFPPEGSSARAVLVKELPLDVSRDNIEERFSFCGKVTDLEIRQGLSSAQAVVVFDSRTAQMAAMLLDKSEIQGRRVRIVSSPVNWTFPDDDDAGGDGDGEDGWGEDEGNGGERRERGPLGNFIGGSISMANAQESFKSVWSRVAEGARNAVAVVEDEQAMRDFVSVTGRVAETTVEKTRNAFRDLDSSLGIRDKTVTAINATKGKASDIDRTLGISEMAGNACRGLTLVAGEIDENLHISSSANALRTRAMENNNVRSGVQAVTSLWDDILTKVRTTSTTSPPNTLLDDETDPVVSGLTSHGH